MMELDSTAGPLDEQTSIETPQGSAQASITPSPVSEEMYEVKVGGKSFKVAKDELISGYQRMRDYTQKTMELSEQRKGWEGERERIYKQVEELRTWLSDPSNLSSYYQQLIQQRGYEDPNTPLTAAQAKSLMEAQLAKEREALKKEFATVRQQTLSEAQASQMLTEVNAAIKGLLETHPELKAVDGVEALLYRDAAAREPQTFEEVKQAIADAAKLRAERIRAHFTEQRKVDAVQKQKLTNGIEPPGNAGVPTAPREKFKLGDKGLMDAVMQDLIAAQKAE